MYRSLTTLEFGKCCDGEGWRTVGTIVLKMKNYYKQSRIKGLHKIKARKANWFGHIWRRNCLLKHII